MRHLFQLVSVCREYLGFGYKADIRPVMVHNRKVPGLRILELVHYTIHLFIHIYVCGSRNHIIVYMKCLVEVLLEHIASDIFQ